MAGTQLFRASLWMVVAVLSLAMMAIAARELSAEFSTFQILFFRGVVSFLVMVAIVMKVGWHRVRTNYLGLHIVRNLAHFVGQFAWIFGIALIPLAEVFALEFTMPIWTAIFASLYLGEKISAVRRIAIFIGFIGVLVMLRPGVQAISPVALVVLGAALSYGVAHTFTKKLSDVDSSIAILFYMSALQLPMSAFAFTEDWHFPSVMMSFWVISIGLFALSAHYCMTRAFKLERVAVLMPIDFLRLPFIAFVGFFAYGEMPDLWVYVGAVIVFLGSWLNLREGSRKP